MVGVAALAALLGLVQWLVVLAAVLMGLEVIKCIVKSKVKLPLLYRLLFACYYLIFIAAAYYIGGRPWIILLMLMIISAADTGGWFFGRKIGGDLMWPAVSPGKTWTGQIAGIICGTMAAIMYGLLGADTFLASLMWIGIGVSLLSQYGDLAASAFKRKLGIKDYGNYLPGHGGLMDRFDGWLFVLPIVWLATL